MSKLLVIKIDCEVYFYIKYPIDYNFKLKYLKVLIVIKNSKFYNLLSFIINGIIPCFHALKRHIHGE